MLRAPTARIPSKTPLWDPDLGSKCCRKQVKPQLCRPPVAFVQLYHNVISGAIKVNPGGGGGGRGDWGSGTNI